MIQRPGDGAGGSKIRETAPVSSPVAGPFPSLGWGGSPGDPPPEGRGDRGAPRGEVQGWKGTAGKVEPGRLEADAIRAGEPPPFPRLTVHLRGGGRDSGGKDGRPRERTPTHPPPRSVPVPVFGGDRAASTPVPDPTARPGGVSLSLSLPPSPPASPRPGRRLPGGCAGPRGAAAGSGRRAAPPAPLPAITHPRILFIHKNRVMR